MKTTYDSRESWFIIKSWNYNTFVYNCIYIILIAYNHIFRKQGSDRLCPASKFAKDLKDDHY